MSHLLGSTAIKKNSQKPQNGQITIMSLFANEYFYLHKEWVHKEGGGHIAPPRFCSSPDCGSAEGFMIVFS